MYDIYLGMILKSTQTCLQRPRFHVGGHILVLNQMLFNCFNTPSTLTLKLFHLLVLVPRHAVLARRQGYPNDPKI
jgi:hypothetical protein